MTSLIAVGGFGISPAAAQCVTAGTTVTCSGNTNSAGDGFGDGTQTGLTVNVLGGATVNGANNGINVDDANTVNNSGTISGSTGVAALNSITVNNAATGAIIGTGGGTGIFSANGPAFVNNAGSITGNRGIDSATGSVVNSGLIVTTGGFAIGINTTSATIVNSGRISSTGGGASAITVTGGQSNITNSGTIVVSGANSTGIIANNVGGTVVTLNNTGLIAANSTSGIGVHARSNSTVTVNNGGVISGAIGIRSDGGGAGNVFNNSGTIIGTGGTAIVSTTGGDTFNFLAGSRIRGEILIGAASAFNFRSGGDISSLTTFGCSCGGFGLTDTGSLASVTGGAPYVINGNRVAILDATAMGMADRSLMDLSQFVSSAIGARSSETSSTGASGAIAFAPVGSAVAEGANAALSSLAYAGAIPNTAITDRNSNVAVWSKAFAGARRQQADGPFLAASTVTYGGVLGIDKTFGNWRAGVFLGAGHGKLNVDLSSQSVGTDYVFGGVYGRHDWSAYFLDLALTVGHAGNSSSRLIANNFVPGGLETATASYGQWFVSPELAYGIRMPMAGGFTLTPALRIRYLAAFFDGYSETGSTQTLSVASRTVQNLEQRAELGLSRDDSIRGNRLKTSVTLGALAQERVGGTAVNTVLIGQNLSFAAPGQNFVGGVYTGLGFDYQYSRGLALFAGAEGTVMSDKSAMGTVRGGARYAF